METGWLAYTLLFLFALLAFGALTVNAIALSVHRRILRRLTAIHEDVLRMRRPARNERDR